MNEVNNISPELDQAITAEIAEGTPVIETEALKEEPAPSTDNS